MSKQRTPSINPETLLGLCDKIRQTLQVTTEVDDIPENILDRIYHRLDQAVEQGAGDRLTHDIIQDQRVRNCEEISLALQGRFRAGALPLHSSVKGKESKENYLKSLKTSMSNAYRFLEKCANNPYLSIQIEGESQHPVNEGLTQLLDCMEMIENFERKHVIGVSEHRKDFMRA